MCPVCCDAGLQEPKQPSPGFAVRIAAADQQAGQIHAGASHRSCHQHRHQHQTPHFASGTHLSVCTVCRVSVCGKLPGPIWGK